MSTQAATQRWYRRDITGLRTIAIVAVVAYHSGASFLPGGFIGVDIFYVISGFLITTLLLREAETTGRIGLSTFWAKRIRRLVPALVVTVAVTLPIAALLGSVLTWDTLAVQGVASVLYVANFLFWRDSTDYFDTGSGQSPFLHMWSLGVEEQFYVLWPLMLIIVLRILAPRHSLRMTLAWVFGGVFVGSLALSIWLTPLSPAASFYLLPTRAWEFAGAGLLALLPAFGKKWTFATSSVLAVLGAVTLMVGLLVINETDLYPGYLALVPFAGTLMLIASGSGSGSVVSPILESRAFVWIGEVSYSWYLWHWPLIVFAAAIFPGNVWAKALAGVVSLGVAALSYHFIEQRVRYATGLTKSVRRTYVTGATATAVVVLLAVGVYSVGAALLRTEPLRAYAAAAETLPEKGCDDSDRAFFGSVEACVLGDPDGSMTIAFIGDSHAGHWRAAIDAAAAESGYRVIFRWKSSCPSIDVIVGDAKAVQDPDCAIYRAETARILEAAKPHAVVISNAYAYDGKVLDANGRRIDLDQQRDAWRDALNSQMDELEALGARVAVVEDNPRMLYNPTLCVSRLGADPSDCISTWHDAHSLIDDFGVVTEQVLASRRVDATFSTDDAICWDGNCHAVDKIGQPIYQDQTHLSEVWTVGQTSALRSFLAQAVG